MADDGARGEELERGRHRVVVQRSSGGASSCGGGRRRSRTTTAASRRRWEQGTAAAKGADQELIVFGEGGVERIYRRPPFCPGGSHHPGQKDLLSRVVVSPGTKGVFGRAGKIPSPRPTFSPGWIYHPGQKGPVFPRSRLILCLFLFLFYFSFKIGFHLLIQLIKL